MISCLRYSITPGKWIHLDCSASHPYVQGRRRQLPTFLPSFLPLPSSTIVEQKSSHSFLDLCSRRRSPHSFLPSHSLLIHHNKSILERAGLRFNSRYDLTLSTFHCSQNAALRHVCVFSIVRRQKELDSSIHFDVSLSLASPF